MVYLATNDKPVSLAEYVSQHRTPSATAAAVAFGVTFGLVPKDSLIALFLLVLIALIPLNHLVACGTGIVSTLLSPLVYPWTHVVGLGLLQSPLSKVVVWLYQFPLIPWLRLENSLVIGGTVVGALCWLPTYWVARRFTFLYLARQNAHEVAEIAAASLRRWNPHSPVEPEHISLSEPASILDTPAQNNRVPISPGGPTPSVDSAAVLLEPSETSVRKMTITPDCSIETMTVEEEVGLLREMLIEVVRYKRPNTDETLDSPAGATPEHAETPFSSDTRNAMKVASNKGLEPHHSSSVPSSNGRSSVDEGVVDDPNHRTHAKPSLLMNSGSLHYIKHPAAREESLRHLLKHIHGSRETKKESETTS